MISAVQEAQAEQRRRVRAPGAAVFSIPILSGMADLMPVIPSFQPRQACPAVKLDAEPKTSAELGQFLGRSVGNGQCVALVRAADPAIGATSSWVAGAAVQGNTALRPGTPIATFDDADRYANATDGSSHAAIYLGQDRNGLVVLDQWAGSAASVRTIPWSAPGATAANTGTAFRVVRPA